jgi:hypothetical protein
MLITNKYSHQNLKWCYNAKTTLIYGIKMTEKPKVLKSKTKKVYKSNKLNKANFANFNLNDYRVYLNAIALIGGVTEQGKYIQPKELPREYRLSALDFSNQFNIDIKNSYRILKQATNKLMNTNIKIEKPELFQTWQINVCERAVYNEKEGTIDIMFTGSIMEYLKQRTKNFTLYNLKEVADLTSIYAVRLYELMQQFNTTTGMLIYAVDQWREILGVQPTQYKLYHQIKQKVFNQAVEEINTKTGYKLTMTEIKEGRKVVRVRFDFTPDKVYPGVDLRTGETTTRHRKPRKQRDVNNTSPAAHPDQQELPNIDVVKPKTLKGKVLKVLGVEPEHIEAAENGTSHIEASKKVITRRVKKIKAVVEKSVEEVKAIITALMEEEGITETQATIKAIKLKLI